jgi:hypothetical protein
MPKPEDYSTTIIYKIACKNPDISDTYVGHTIDIVKRRLAHKNNVCSEKSGCRHIKLYKFIRENGGWDNWTMEIVACYNCNNLMEAKQKEQEHYVKLKATLNSVEPMKLKETIIEKNKNNTTESTKNKYSCDACNYICSKKSDFDKHELTKKHKTRTRTIEFKCKHCNKEYKAKNSLWYHERKCKILNETETVVSELEPEKLTQFDIIKTLILENSEMKKLVMEQSKYTSDIINKIVEQSTSTADMICKIVEQNAYILNAVLKREVDT